jgi:hypothetical protein
MTIGGLRLAAKVSANKRLAVTVLLVLPPAPRARRPPGQPSGTSAPVEIGRQPPAPVTIQQRIQADVRLASQVPGQHLGGQLRVIPLGVRAKTDPVHNPASPDHEVFRRDRRRVSRSDPFFPLADLMRTEEFEADLLGQILMAHATSFAEPTNPLAEPVAVMLPDGSTRRQDGRNYLTEPAVEDFPEFCSVSVADNEDSGLEYQ